MKKMIFIFLIILGLAAGCTSTESKKGAESNKGENIPLDAVEAEGSH